MRFLTRYFVEQLLRYMSLTDCNLRFLGGFSLWATQRERVGKGGNKDMESEVSVSFYLPSSSQQKAAVDTAKCSYSSRL